MRGFYGNLYRKMQERGVSSRQLACVAGVSKLAVLLKLHGLIEWQLHEVLRICVFFRVVDAEELFSN